MRISGITLSDTKRLEYALTAVYGVGHARALAVLGEAKVDPATRAKDISPEQEATIRTIIESGEQPIEGELRRTVSGNIKRLKDIGSYRGMRHARKLPVRGQRTKTNARTHKGVKKTMGSGKKKVDKK
ncbi:30S ribosomal protein S13 [Patescibacteria group bacterium]|jgi:small subunit ribosomal protein S13|nr:30S ribosomal protein S13 [Patescibacteria group bacterium]